MKTRPQKGATISLLSSMENALIPVGLFYLRPSLQAEKYRSSTMDKDADVPNKQNLAELYDMTGYCQAWGRNPFKLDSRALFVRPQKTKFSDSCVYRSPDKVGRRLVSE